MTRLIFVRHGESMANERNLYGGSTNFALTERGKEQAKATAEELKKYKIDVVYSSDLQRAYLTGKYIAAKQNCPIIKDRAFREMDGGLWEGYVFDRIGDDFPEQYALWKQNICLCTPPEGEMFVDVYKRVSAEIEKIASKNKDKCVCITAHASPIRCAETYFAGGLDHLYDFGWVSNSSITIFDLVNGAWKCTLRSYDKHLGSMVTSLPDSI